MSAGMLRPSSDAEACELLRTMSKLNKESV